MLKTLSGSVPSVERGEVREGRERDGEERGECLLIHVSIMVNSWMSR
ncbi:hypothetical protein [Thermocladium modestius]|nr:hypothetical protein [Thermocladium modestius]